MKTHPSKFSGAAFPSLGLLLAGSLFTSLPHCPSVRAAEGQKIFQAGAFAVDITPTNYPVIVNAMFTERSATNAVDPLHARCLVLDDGTTRLAIVVVDICMMPRELIDRAKGIASKQTGIPTDRMLVSATHTHSAPSAMGCLGSRQDIRYAAFLPGKIAEGIVQAAKNLAPARIGWAVVDDWEHTHNRRWIRRPDKIISDPFGRPTVRANMHPGYESPDVVGPSGPVDPGLSVLGVQSPGGRPIALLANYSQHYCGSPLLSADYCGKFAEHVAALVTTRQTSFMQPGAQTKNSPALTSAATNAFVGIMSQGTSGDLMWMDYGAPRKEIGYDAYAQEVAQRAFAVSRKIQYRDWVPLKMAERTLALNYRVPDEARLAWARQIADGLQGRLPKTHPEIYALEAIFLHERPATELKLQALRIGELGIAAIPNEVYALTGLKIKAQSPLMPTFNIELANGAEGYIPPPEQHQLGGYTTWPARTAGLEVQAEPRIVETVLSLLEEVSGQPRRNMADTQGPYAKAVLDAKPLAYWRLNEAVVPIAHDATEHKHDAIFEDGVALYVPGADNSTGFQPDQPQAPNNFSGDQINRAAHFAGGRMKASLPELGAAYSVELWFWNGLSNSARAVTGCFFSRCADGDKEAVGDQLGISGTNGASGKIFFFNDNQNDQVLAGRTGLEWRRWHHVALVRDGRKVAVYLDGNTTPDIFSEAESSLVGPTAELFLGGRCSNFANFEGKMDEVAIYDRALTPVEIAAHYKASGITPRLQAQNNPGNGATSGSGTPSPALRAPSPPLGAGERDGVRGRSDTTSRPNSPTGSTSQVGKGEDSAPQKPLPPFDSPPLSPAESLKRLHVREGFEVELIAAEPLLESPVAIDWDEHGRLWVVEMVDYPLGLDGKGKPGGRLRVLEDTDGDGRYDKSTLFAEGLNFPTGLLTWRDGVLVTAAPEILFLEDSNGDGIADVSQPLYTGLLQGNQQLRVNGLRWGLDNRVHCANGAHVGGYGATTKIKSVLTGQEFTIGSRDFRFRPDTGELDPQSGPSQFGRNRDNWGNWFGVQNSWPLWHYVLQDHYLRRNPYVPAPDPVQQVITPKNPKVYPAGRLEKRYHSFDESGHFTSACAAMIYQDQWLFGADGAMHSFTCEPFHNLVHHELVDDDGVSFKARRAPQEQTSEFLASEDRWFRPVMTRTGPDGALWVVDMYRYMIEHPEWLPPEGRAELMPHYRAGEDKGRIWRVSPKGARAALPAATTTSKKRAAAGDSRAPMRLDKLSTAELVAALDSPNGWQRDKVQQLLVWRGGKAAVPLLEKLANESNNPLARLHALCTLDGLNALRPEWVERALGDPHPGIRVHALRLGEPRSTPGVISAALKLVDDQSAKVRLQLACTLGEWADPHAGEALGRLAVANHGDKFITAAVMSSAVPHSLALVDAAVAAGGPVLTSLAEPLLNLALALNQRDSMARLLRPTLTAGGGRFTARQIEAFGQFLDALARRKMTLSEFTKMGDALTKLLSAADDLFAAAERLASDKKQPAAQRVAAAAVLSRSEGRRSEALRLLAGWLAPQFPGEVQRAAVKALGLTGDASVPDLLTRAWPALGPETRLMVLDELLGRETWAFELVRRVETGQISASALGPTRRGRLLRHSSARVKELAAKVLNAGAASTRAKVVEEFRPALSLPGDVKRGAGVFAKACAVCHKLGGVGNDIGPNLQSVTAHPPERLLVSILDPNATIEPGYVAYTATVAGGGELYGIIAAETANSLVLKLADGSTRTLLHQDIESLRSSNLSLMPEGLEAGMSRQDLADLIQFLRTPAGGH